MIQDLFWHRTFVALKAWKSEGQQSYLWLACMYEVQRTTVRMRMQHISQAW